MSQDCRTRELTGLFWKMKHLAIIKAKLAVLILYFLCEGLLCQDSDYKVKMPQSISACRGLRVHVPCQFTFPPQASSEEPQGYWFKKESLGYPTRSRPGRLVASSDKKAAIDRSAANRFQFIGDPKQGNCSFSITNAQREDEGRYYFRIEQGDLKYTFVNHDHQIHTSPAIFVSGCLPVVKIVANVTRHRYTALCSWEPKGDLESVVAQESESISLQCKVESKLDPTLSWTKGNKSLSTRKQDKESGLLLSDVSPEDAGEYQCQAENLYGSAKKTLQLCVQYGPRPSSPQQNSTCRRKGNDILCTCSVHSWPPPQIQWQVDGKTINNSIPREALWVTSQVQRNELTSFLNWTGSQNGDHHIICFATNPSGAYTFQFVLSSSITRDCPSILFSAICWPLMAAGLIFLATCLIWLLKRRKALGDPNSQPAANDTSEVYSNVMLRNSITHSCILQDPVGRYSGAYYNLQPAESMAYSCVLPE